MKLSELSLYIAICYHNQGGALCPWTSIFYQSPNWRLWVWWQNCWYCWVCWMLWAHVAHRLLTSRYHHRMLTERCRSTRTPVWRRAVISTLTDTATSRRTTAAPTTIRPSATATWTAPRRTPTPPAPIFVVSSLTNVVIIVHSIAIITGFVDSAITEGIALTRTRALHIECTTIVIATTTYFKPVMLSFLQSNWSQEYEASLYRTCSAYLKIHATYSFVT